MAHLSEQDKVEIRNLILNNTEAGRHGYDPPLSEVYHDVIKPRYRHGMHSEIKDFIAEEFASKFHFGKRKFRMGVIRQAVSRGGGDEGGADFDCPYCGQSFPNAQAAWDHVSSQHPDQGGGGQQVNVNVQGGGQTGGGRPGGSRGGGAPLNSVETMSERRYDRLRRAIADAVEDEYGLGDTTEEHLLSQLGAMRRGNRRQLELDRVAAGSRATKVNEAIVPVLERYGVEYGGPSGKVAPGMRDRLRRARDLFSRGEHGKHIAAVERIVDFLDASDPMRAKLLEWDTGALERAEEILWRDRAALEQYKDRDELRRLMRNMDNVQELERFWKQYLQGRASDVRDLEGVNVPGGVTGLPRYVVKKLVRSVEKQERVAPFAAIALAPLIALGGMAAGLGPFGLIFGALFFGWGYKNLESRNKLLGALVSIGAIYVAVLDLVFIATNLMFGGVNSLMTLYGLASAVVFGTAVYLIDWDMVRWAYDNFATLLFGPKGDRDAGYEILFFFTVVLGFIASVSGILQVTAVSLGASSGALMRIIAFFLSILGPLALYHLSKNWHYAVYRPGNAWDRMRGRGGPANQPPDYSASPGEFRKWADESRYQGRGGGRDMGAAGAAFERWDQEEAEQRVENIVDGLGGGTGAGLLREAGQALLERYRDGRMSEDQFSEGVGRLREMAEEYRTGDLDRPRPIKEFISEIRSGDWPGRGG